LSTADRHPVVVVGAGPAGLATSAELRRRGIEHVVLERGDTVGHSWKNLYDSLTLHTGKHLSALPGMSFGRSVPLFPSRSDFVDYLHRYADVLELPIETGRTVTALERRNCRSLDYARDDGDEWLVRDSDEWLVRTDRGDITARDVVVATGIIASPRVPVIPGRERFRGRVMHSVEYRRPAEFANRRVLIVGVGNSGGEIASELANSGARVTIAVRSGANVVPRQIAGIPVQYLSFAMRALPARVRTALAGLVGRMTELRRGKPVLPKPAHGPLDAIPLIGFHLVDAIRAGKVAVRGGVVALTGTGAQFTDGAEEPFDDVILATGFTAALAPLGDLVRRDAKGFADRSDRVTSADQPHLYFVGHSYDATGGLYNIRRDSVLAAERIAAGIRRGAA
jgi:cation diffusion facilitator CzcD-associated flavoprotein CzcO